jgi:hypothetical protein
MGAWGDEAAWGITETAFARGGKRFGDFAVMDEAAKSCIYLNRNIVVEELKANS